MLNTHKLMVAEAKALTEITVEAINAEISDGPVTDPEEFNLMMIALRNAVRAQQRTIDTLAREVGITP